MSQFSSITTSCLRALSSCNRCSDARSGCRDKWAGTSSREVVHVPTHICYTNFSNESRIFGVHLLRGRPGSVCELPESLPCSLDLDAIDEVAPPDDRVPASRRLGPGAPSRSTLSSELVTVCRPLDCSDATLHKTPCQAAGKRGRKKRIAKTTKSSSSWARLQTAVVSSS